VTHSTEQALPADGEDAAAEERRWRGRFAPRHRCGFHPLAVRRFAPTIKRIHQTKYRHDLCGSCPDFVGDPQLWLIKNEFWS
jgi:hypothetical protein